MITTMFSIILLMLLLCASISLLRTYGEKNPSYILYGDLNDKVDKELDNKISYYLKHFTVKLIQRDEFYIYITFKENLVTLKLWNRNKYYAWCTDGCFLDSPNEYEWNNKRPKRSTMWKLYKLLKNYE